MKRTKKTTQTLLEISKTLPKHKYQSIGKLSEPGDILIERGMTHDGDNIPILPHKNYIKSILVENEVNHFNRLKSAFDSNGKIGVKAYVKRLIKPQFELQVFIRIDALL
jgi:hypothetical protein